MSYHKFPINKHEHDNPFKIGGYEFIDTNLIVDKDVLDFTIGEKDDS